ncbi:class I SAM-dependent methyltransferase [Methanobrevibacter sp.]|uniref:class I SAM-dependent methyltransferase n=1 Tax=Methanobrevibacter sp. TaxID=66852 RepID=UPI003869B660
MGFFENMGNPQGKLGNMQLKSMNKEHTPVSLWGLKHLDIKDDDIILDIGCGGGMNVKRMAEKAKKVFGIDYSIVSVELSTEVNEDLIKNGLVEIVEGNVQSLPFEDETFDIVTAFETVYFWPDIEKCFGEVKRVLKPGGVFLIGMESNGDNNFIMKFWKHFIDMEMYTDEEIASFLENNGFSEITAYIRDGRKKQEIIKVNGKETRVNDDYSNVSFSDKFLEWVTVVAKK